MKVAPARSAYSERRKFKLKKRNKKTDFFVLCWAQNGITGMVRFHCNWILEKSKPRLPQQ